MESMSEAEKHLADRSVDIILLDLGLPDAQGMEAVRRAHAAAPRVPLVVLTGWTTSRWPRRPCKRARKTISSRARSMRARFCGRCATPSNARSWKKRCSWKRSAHK